MAIRRASSGFRATRPVRGRRAASAAQPQRSGRSPLEIAAHRQRDDAGLLGDDDGHRVVLFRQAERRAMTGSQVAADARVHRQREKAGGRGHAIALHDRRTVMERRPRLKDPRQQIVGDHRVERNAALDVIAQSDLPLDDDDRADAPRRQRGRRHDQLLDRFVGLVARSK